MYQRRKRNSSKVNLTFSVIFHSAIVLALFFFAAREGVLGKRFQTLAVIVAPREKKVEAPKPKPEEAKIAPQKAPEAPKVAATLAPPPRAEAAAPSPAAEVAPAVAPEAVNVSGMDFSDGAREVQTGDANTVYKALVEHTLRSRWDRPEDINDENYVAEVELNLDPQGNVIGSRWLQGSGDARWDASVKAVIAGTKAISSRPPKGFPEKFNVRFDVESMRVEAVAQVSSR
jgi:outer membrane biosynthesis protein TonB